jgi:hypothetical protein
MSAHESINPWVLRQLATRYEKKNVAINWDNPNRNDPESNPDFSDESGVCYECSEDFVERSHLGHTGLNPKHVKQVSLNNDARGIGHSAVEVGTTHGPYVVDFTYRQYNNKAKSAVVLPKRGYLRKIEKDNSANTTEATTYDKVGIEKPRMKDIQNNPENWKPQQTPPDMRPSRKK